MDLGRRLRSLMREAAEIIADSKARQALPEEALADLATVHSLLDRVLMLMLARGAVDPREIERAGEDLERILREGVRDR
ncbi:MAG: hypothetical protein DRJ56_07920 [Thermoprotei archaeon]|nr:MAG: hypothetical protein DRJ56_07920 [Thermoprotei archaeon]